MRWSKSGNFSPNHAPTAMATTFPTNRNRGTNLDGLIQLLSSILFRVPSNRSVCSLNPFSGLPLGLCRRRRIVHRQ